MVPAAKGTARVGRARGGVARAKVARWAREGVRSSRAREGRGQAVAWLERSASGQVWAMVEDMGEEAHVARGSRSYANPSSETAWVSGRAGPRTMMHVAEPAAVRDDRADVLPPSWVRAFTSRRTSFARAALRGGAACARGLLAERRWPNRPWPSPFLVGPTPLGRGPGVFSVPRTPETDTSGVFGVRPPAVADAVCVFAVRRTEKPPTRGAGRRPRATKTPWQGGARY